MKLREYISISSWSAVDFAARVGVSPATVSYWASGKKTPSKDHCELIEFVTAGVVTCEDLRPDLNWNYIRSTKRKAA